MNTCLRCGAEMEDGFIPDQTYGAILNAVWVAGEPVTSRWSGIKLKGTRQIPIAAARCTSCGMLELSAN